MAEQNRRSKTASKQETLYVQSVVGSLLYYGRAIDCTILPALNQIATNQATPTIKTKQAIHRLLDSLKHITKQW